MTDDNKIQLYTPEGPSALRRFPVPGGGSNSFRAEQEMDFRSFLMVLRNRRKTVITVLATVMFVVFALSMLMNPVYRSESTLEIENEAPDITTVAQLMKLDPATNMDVETQQGILKSDTLARRVIDQLHLTELKEFNPNAPGAIQKGWIYLQEWWHGAPSTASTQPATKVDPKTYENVLAWFEGRLKVDPVRDTRLVKVSFESGDPNLSARVVNSLVSNYLQLHQEDSRKLSKELADQLTATKAELEKSERRMLRYARQKGLLYLQTGNGTTENIADQRLRQIQEELTRAQAERYQKESVYQLVQKGDYGSLPGVFQDQLLQNLTIQVAGLKRQYAELSATFTDDYPKVKQIKSQLAELQKVLDRERARAAENITNDYLAAVRREALLVREFDKQKNAASTVAEASSQYNILKRSADTDNQLYESLLQKVKEATLVARIKADNVRVVDVAEPKFSPVRPKILLNLALALIVGLGLGIGAAFFQERLDTSLKTVDEVDRFLDVPALAIIPSAESLPRSLGNGNGDHQHVDGPLIVDVFHPATPLKPENAWYRVDKHVHQDYSPLVEAFRNLGTSVMLEAEGRKEPLRTLLITSSQPGEGKTTVSVNLAITLAQQGQRVLLIDADMRRPSVHRALGFRNIRGLSGCLKGATEWAPCILPGSVPGLDILPAGQSPTNPVALLSSSRMKTLINQALEDYDHVIVDSPALMLNLADARILAGVVDGTILVIRSGLTPRDFVRRVRGQLGNMVGVVLNSINLESLEYGYGHYYGYGNSSEGKGVEDELPTQIEAGK